MTMLTLRNSMNCDDKAYIREQHHSVMTSQSVAQRVLCLIAAPKQPAIGLAVMLIEVASM